MYKYVYCHICCINNWEEIVGGIFNRIKDSALYDELREIRCCVLGKRECLQNEIFTDEKIRIVYHSEDVSLYEVVTLNKLLEDSKKEDFYVLYVHSKGVSKPENRNVRDWVNYMLYFNVYLYDLAIQNLKYNDCCGVNALGNHYSGNFWWSKSTYIRKLNKLPPIEELNYTGPETWLFTGRVTDNAGSCKWVSLWNSGIRHYREPYPEQLYVDSPTRYDPRFKRLLSNYRYITINNYKCGFSSSNLLEYQKVLTIFPQDKIVLFYRNIFTRAISTFINWCITDERYQSGEGWLLANMANALGDSGYKDFVGLLRDGKIGEAFGVYVESLGRIYTENDHTLPQTRVLDYYEVDRVDYMVDLEDNESFYRITNVPFPYDRTNKSAKEVRDLVLLSLKHNERWQEALRNVYEKDIRFFRDANIDVAGNW